MKEARESEARMWLLLDAAPNGMVMVDREGTIVLANSQIEALFGYPRGELLGQKIEILIPERFRASHAVMRRAFTAEPSTRPMGAGRDLYARCRDGNEFPVEIGLNPVETPDGLRVLASIIDITERRRAEEALRKSEALASGVLSAALDAIIIVDHLGMVVEWNRAAERVFGYKRTDSIRRELAELIIPPGLREAHRRGLAHYLVSREGPVLGRLIELPAMHADGTEFPVELYITPIPIEGPPLFTGFARDITERKAAEAALKESETRLRLFVEGAPAGIAMFDRDMRYIAVSRRFAHDYHIAEKDLICRSHYDIFPEIPVRWREIHRRCLAGETLRCEEDQFLHADGRTDWVRWEIRPWRDANNEIGGIILFSEVITERKAAAAALESVNADLERSNRHLADFASIVAHDLKAPVRSISTLANWLQTDYGEKIGAEGRKHLDDLVKRAQRMDAMIEGVLHYSRIGRDAERSDALELRPLLEEVVADLLPPASVRVALPERLPIVTGDPARLRQVFQNLIGNAIKHLGKPSGEVHVTCAERGAVWEFSVSDNGPGIEPRHFERIFKMFQTLTPKDKTDSTGIGLALVKRIVEYAGGRVWVESRVGEGSTFSFTWPKTQKHAEPANGP